MITLLISDMGIRPKKVKGLAQGHFERAADSWPLFDILPFQFLSRNRRPAHVENKKAEWKWFLGILHSG